MTLDQEWTKYRKTGGTLSRDAYREQARSSQPAPALERILFIPDVHRPYHDKRAYSLMIRAAKFFKPHHTIVLGDFADFYAVSSHSRSPARTGNLEEEIDDVNAGLDELDQLGGNRYFVAGNHEDRLERYLTTQAPALFHMVKVERLFRLKQRGWSYTSYGDSMKIGRLHVTHDCGNAGPYAHIKAQAAYEGNAVIGHTHRMASVFTGTADGKSHVGMSFGWLGDANAVDYLHRIQVRRAWQLGFGIGYMEENGTVHLQQVPIVNYTAVLNGTLIR